MRKPGSILLASLIALAVPILAQSTPDAVPAADSLTSGTLTFWVANRLKTDAEIAGKVRAAALHADYPKLDVQFKTFSDIEFLSALSTPAKFNSNPPDIVFVDSGGQRDQLMNTGGTQMVGIELLHSPGWWVIPATSPNPKLAKAFILWLEQPSSAEVATLQTHLLTADDENQIRQASIAVVNAYGSAGKAPGAGVLDPAIANFAWESAVHTPGFGPQQSFKATVDLVGGNRNLAFSEVSALDEGENFYGLRHAAVLLRRQDSAWQVLLLEPNESFTSALRLLQNLDGLHMKSDPPGGVGYLFPLAPADESRVSRSPRPQLDIEQEGELGSLLAIEWQYFDPGTKLWTPVQLSPLQASQDHILKVSAPFGVGQQPHRWRVWSVSQSGSVTLSDWRTINFIT